MSITALYRDFNFFLYDAVLPSDTQFPSVTWFITTIYTYLLKEVVYHRGKQPRIEEVEISIYSYKEMPW